MDERAPTKPLLWIHPTDEEGQPIDPALIRAAHKLFSRVLYLTGQILHDETRAATLLEQAVRAASRAADNRPEDEGIVNREAYLYRTVVRLLCAIRDREGKIEYGHPPEDLERRAGNGKDDWVTRLDRQLQVEKILGYADQRTRQIYLLRSAGDSWTQVAKQLRIRGAENARCLFRYGLCKARARLLRRRPAKTGNTAPVEQAKTC